MEMLYTRGLQQRVRDPKGILGRYFCINYVNSHISILGVTAEENGRSTSSQRELEECLFSVKRFGLEAREQTKYGGKGQVYKVLAV